MARPRVIIVTGASSGIGRATARALARQGERLVLVARGLDRLEATAAECRQLGADAVDAWPADVADRSAVDEIFARAVAAHGRVDGVVNSAGVAAYGRFVDIEPDVLERVMAVNFLGTANVARAALRQFADQDGGSVVLVGSLLGKIATPYMSPYLASKWAVQGLVRAIQIEARQYPGVGVSMVSPGGVDTPIYRWAATALGRQGQPPPPVDPPEKVARAIVAALDRPRRERSVGLANGATVLGFRLLPAVFDQMVTPLMSRFGLDPQRTPDGTGNVFASIPGSTETAYGDHDPAPERLIRRGLNSVAALAALPREASSQPGRVSVERQVRATPEQVWEVLADGWLYASWVVGASRTRDVDVTWPAEGSKIHHSFGIWPAVIDDTSEVQRAEIGRELKLRARGNPVGEAEVIVSLTAQPDGTTLVTIEEDAVAGPGTLVPRALRQMLIAPRNREALCRLAILAERGAGRGVKEAQSG